MPLDKAPRAVLVGEGMLELARHGSDWKLGYGGDTLNTAIHLARQGIETGYLTALGEDELSADLRRQWTDEGLQTQLVLTDPARHPGLYAIAVDAAGERSFTYWRGESAVRGLFACQGIEEAIAYCESAEILAFSLISLAILPDDGRRRLLSLAQRLRDCGAMVAFDGNYRPCLWPAREDAVIWRDKAIAVSTIGLPTLDDEQMLDATDARSVERHWRQSGCAETVVKLGAQGCLLPDGAIIAPERQLVPVDTSGAGDAFNAGYLGARLNGAQVEQAARAGHALASWTIMRNGAIPPRDQ